MKSRKLTVIIVSLCMCVSVLSGCGSTAEKEQVQHAAETQTATAEPDTSLEDGEYTVNVELEGGSGTAYRERLRQGVPACKAESIQVQE